MCVHGAPDYHPTLHEQGLAQLSKPCSSFLSQLMFVLNTLVQHQLNSHMYLKSHAQNNTCTHMYMYVHIMYIYSDAEREREIESHLLVNHLLVMMQGGL